MCKSTEYTKALDSRKARQQAIERARKDKARMRYNMVPCNFGDNCKVPGLRKV